MDLQCRWTAGNVLSEGLNGQTVFRHIHRSGLLLQRREMDLPDFPLRGVYANNCVYETVRSWDSFEPALNRAELLDPESIWQFALDIPEEWYEGVRHGLAELVEKLSPHPQNHSKSHLVFSQFPPATRFRTGQNRQLFSPHQ